jgi:hypothetical protein
MAGDTDAGDDRDLLRGAWTDRWYGLPTIAWDEAGYEGVTRGSFHNDENRGKTGTGRANHDRYGIRGECVKRIAGPVYSTPTMPLALRPPRYSTVDRLMWM